MSSMATAAIVFACVFGGALVGLYSSRLLPEHHLSKESQDTVKLATGLIATMAALVLGLMISSAKSSFDRISNELAADAAKVVVLDQLMKAYGPETRELRDLLKRHYANAVELLTSGEVSGLAKLDTPETVNRAERLQAGVGALAPRNDVQRQLQARMGQINGELFSSRWLMLLHREGSIPMPLLVVQVSWLVIIFAAFGLLAPRNLTVIAALLLCALSASGAILLILEMDRPLDGIISISGVPLRGALAHLGQ
jgi:hypothetical protein